MQWFCVGHSPPRAWLKEITIAFNILKWRSVFNSLKSLTLIQYFIIAYAKMSRILQNFKWYQHMWKIILWRNVLRDNPFFNRHSSKFAQKNPTQRKTEHFPRKEGKNNISNTLNTSPAECTAAHQLGSFEDFCTTVFSYSISVT